MIGGPLFMLQWRGAVCPCLEKSEDAGARQALAYLSTVTVQWLRKGREKGVSGMVSGWFQSAKAGKVPTADAVESKLHWIDKDSGGPELQIKPLPNTKVMQDDGTISLQKQSSGYIKTVRLKDIDKVTLIDGTTTLILQQENDSGRMKDLATIQVDNNNNNNNNNNNDADEGDASAVAAQIQEAFTQLIEWDGRRRAAIPEDERELDEQDGIKARAQKAAHFAKREIELQQQRRDREKKKARFVQGAGGLKYTALAMANRMDD